MISLRSLNGMKHPNSDGYHILFVCLTQNQINCFLNEFDIILSIIQFTEKEQKN